MNSPVEASCDVIDVRKSADDKRRVGHANGANDVSTGEFLFPDVDNCRFIILI